MSLEDDRLDRQAGDARDVQRVFDELPLMVIVVDGPELLVSAATGAYRSYVGRTEMIGAPLREVFAEIAGQHVVPYFEDAYATGEPADLREWRVWIDHPSTDRRIELFVDFTVTPRRDPDGRTTGLIMVVQDATERVRERRAAQERAEAAEERYEQVRSVVDTLQRELLPAGVPVLPRVQLAASYLLADADTAADVDTAAGGDWFDAVPLGDGRVGLVVGDVVGHGVAAAATMGQLRVVVAEHLVATGDAAAAVRAADRATDRIRGARAATVCVAVLDPGTGDLTVVSAGHPPPLLVPADGDTRFLAAVPGAPLGVGDGARAAGEARLLPGDLLLLYTDGILERPGRHPAQSTVELARVVTDVARDRALPAGTGLTVERVCEQAIEILTRGTGHRDDITLLAAQLGPEPAALSLTVPADAEHLVPVRAGLDAWLRGAHVAADDAGLVRHAVLELVTNAVEHAYLDRPDPGGCTVSAELTASGRLRVQVADRGRWREPHPSVDRGLGLQVVAGLMDTLHLDHDEHGTTATVLHRLHRPARLPTPDTFAPAPAGPSPADPLLVLDQPSAPAARLRIDGPVDSSTAATVELEILRAGSTGARSLTVDLTGVSHLASAGVAVLHRVAEVHRRNHTELRLYSPTGSVADVILTLVALPHHTDDPG